MRWVCLLSVALAGAGCQLGEPPVSSESQAIIGGTVHHGDLAVVQYGGCTGTLIAPRVVLTAAHCIDGRIQSGNTSGGSVRFGTRQEEWIGTAPIIDMVMHRRYAPPSFKQYDIALLRLGADPPEGVEPMEVNFDRLDESHIGLPLRTVGFGNDDGVNNTGFGTKRRVDLTIDALTPFHVGLGTRERNTCQGDSGGPSIAELDGVEKVVSVTSFGSDNCRGRSYTTRTDVFAEEFLIPIIDAWSGPCQHDGVCVTEGCRTPDPDCDPCGFDRFCMRECETPDLDCPLGGMTGDSCQDRYDCEGRACVTAPDEPRIRYCSSSCESSEDCHLPVARCEELDDGAFCTYAGTTPGAQGAPCHESSDCRSSMCDRRDGICVEACGEGEACPEEFSCQEIGDGLNACRLPAGGCRAAGAGAPGPLALLLLGLLLGLGARRRERV